MHVEAVYHPPNVYPSFTAVSGNVSAASYFVLIEAIAVPPFTSNAIVASFAVNFAYNFMLPFTVYFPFAVTTAVVQFASVNHPSNVYPVFTAVSGSSTSASYFVLIASIAVPPFTSNVIVASFAV